MLQALVIAQDIDVDGHHDLDGGWWIVMMIGMLLFWALVVVAVVWAVRAWTGGQGPGGPGPARHESTPQEVLERRLAEGEISVEEYEERRRVLSGPAGTARTANSPSDSP